MVKVRGPGRRSGAANEPNPRGAPSRRTNSTALEPTSKLARLTKSLAILALTIASLQQCARPAQANAALSEVWSETDGLQVKYSTNHDDLLSSKGSELSLSSDQQNQRHADSAPASAGGGEASEEGGKSGQESSDSGSQTNEPESSSSAGEDSPAAGSGASEGQQKEGEESEGSNLAAGGEQTNDEGAADSRQTEKAVPLHSLAGRVQSYSSTSSKHHHHSSPKSAAKSRTSLSTPTSFRDVPAASTAPQQRLAKASSRALDSAETFESLGHSLDDSNDNKNNEAPAASEEQTSADPESAEGGGPLAREGPSALSRFRQPGRLFKEAVKMISGESGSKKSADQADADEDDEDESEHSPKEPTGEKASSKQANNDQEDNDNDSAPRAAWGRPTGDGRRSSAGAAERRPPSEEQSDDEQTHGPAGVDPTANEVVNEPNQLYRSAAGGQGAFAGAPRAQNQFAIEQDDGEGALFHEPPAIGQGRPMFYSGRAMLAASSQKGLTQPLTAKLAAPSADQRQPEQNHPIKQLAYFRGLSTNQLNAALSGGRQSFARSNANEASRERPAPDNSPDSVRDNFISPGHYPGSMPHLTQAASEFARPATSSSSGDSKDSPAALGSSTLTTASDKSDEKSQSHEKDALKSSSQSAADADSDRQNRAGDKNHDEVNAIASQNDALTAASDTANKSDDANSAQQKASDTKGATSAVTPMPELQLESQQIMAPILISTTTMAPMPSTPPLPQDGSSSSSSEKSTSTTTKGPNQLKRFKFRRYPAESAN